MTWNENFSWQYKRAGEKPTNLQTAIFGFLTSVACWDVRIKAGEELFCALEPKSRAAKQDT